MTSHSTSRRRGTTPGSEVPLYHGLSAQYYRHRAEENLEDMNCSFEQFDLMSGLEKIALMLEQNAEAVAGLRHRSSPDKLCHRWGTAPGTACYYGGRIGIRLPRVRDKRTRKEVPLPTWAWLSKCEDILRWTYMALMGVFTCNVRRAAASRGAAFRRIRERASPSPAFPGAL